MLGLDSVSRSDDHIVSLQKLGFLSARLSVSDDSEHERDTTVPCRLLSDLRTPDTLTALLRRKFGAAIEPVHERYLALTWRGDNPRKLPGEVEVPPPLTQHAGGRP